jgi:hypothetical protein
VGVHPPTRQRFAPILADIDVPQGGTALKVLAFDNPERVVCRRPDFTDTYIKRHYQPVVVGIVAALNHAQPPYASLEIVGPHPLAGLHFADGPQTRF